MSKVDRELDESFKAICNEVVISENRLGIKADVCDKRLSRFGNSLIISLENVPELSEKVKLQAKEELENLVIGQEVKFYFDIGKLDVSISNSEKI